MYLDFARRTQRYVPRRHSRSREIPRFVTHVYHFTLPGVSQEPCIMIPLSIWNIDDLSEHEIINVLRQMTMAAIAYLTDNDDHNAAQLLFSGFFGTLRCWWDNCLNDSERKFLQTSTNDEREQNAVHRIIYAITKHFIGDPRFLQERSS